MDKTFNELFDDFFKRNDKQTDKLSDSIKDEAKKMIDILHNFKDLDNIDESIEKEIDDTLGKPDKVELYKEGGLYYEKRIWHTDGGDFVKIIVTDDPAFLSPVEEDKIPQPEKSLKEQLADALAGEEFEIAATLRDKIKAEEKALKPKKPRKPRKAKLL